MALFHATRHQGILVDNDTHALQSFGIILQRVVYFFLDAMLVLFVTRFILRLLGANPGNGFVEMLYSLTYPFVAPFSGIFGPVSSNAVAAFEVSTLLAMFILGLLAYGLARLIGVLTLTRA